MCVHSGDTFTQPIIWGISTMGITLRSVVLGSSTLGAGVPYIELSENDQHVFLDLLQLAEIPVAKGFQSVATFYEALEGRKRGISLLSSQNLKTFGDQFDRLERVFATRSPYMLGGQDTRALRVGLQYDLIDPTLWFNLGTDSQGKPCLVECGHAIDVETAPGSVRRLRGTYGESHLVMPIVYDSILTSASYQATLGSGKPDVDVRLESWLTAMVSYMTGLSGLGRNFRRKEGTIDIAAPVENQERVDANKYIGTYAFQPSDSQVEQVKHNPALQHLIRLRFPFAPVFEKAGLVSGVLTTVQPKKAVK